MIRIGKYLSKAEIAQFCIGFIFVVGQVWFDLKLPDYMSHVTTLVETPGSKMSDIWMNGGKMLAVSLASATCAVITGYVTARVGASFGQRLRSLEFRGVESFGPAEMSRFSTASLITRSTNDITQIQMFITMGILLLVKSPIMAVWAVYKIAGKGLEWTIETAIGVVILLLVIALLMWLVMPKFRSMQKLTDNINQVAQENLTGLRVVRAYNAEDYQEAKFAKANKTLTDTQLFTTRMMSVMIPLMNTIMNGLVLSVYWVGAYLIQAAGMMDKLTLFSNMVVFSSYAIQVIMSFLMLSMVFVLLPRADVSAQRVLEVINTEPMVKDGALQVQHLAQGSPTFGSDAPADISAISGVVEFNNVSFTYPDSREPMLKDISFSAQHGQTVAFIGSTGSGKSSLVNLIPRFYDASEGEVLVDGVNVRDYSLRALRDKIGYVPQQSVLFKGTVESNVSYGDQPGDSTKVEMIDSSTVSGRKREARLLAQDSNRELNASQKQRIREASEVAQADEFIDAMQDGYEGKIAQGGSNVSGGQRQRLSIARAVYRNPEILIFDDSFSALDFKTDSQVRGALAKHAREATKLIVAQRIGTIMDADRIVVLDQGRIVGQGTHRELLKTCTVYREIAESQLSSDELVA